MQVWFLLGPHISPQWIGDHSWVEKSFQGKKSSRKCSRTINTNKQGVKQLWDIVSDNRPFSHLFPTGGVQVGHVILPQTCCTLILRFQPTSGTIFWVAHWTMSTYLQAIHRPISRYLRLTLSYRCILSCVVPTGIYGEQFDVLFF